MANTSVCTSTSEDYFESLPKTPTDEFEPVLGAHMGVQTVRLISYSRRVTMVV